MLDKLLLHFQAWSRESLIHLHLIATPDLVSEYADRHLGDTQLRAGKVLIIRNGNMLKSACLLCPGGCGEKIMLRLSGQRQPQWQVQRDWLGRLTLRPSVRQKNRCECHFWIRAGHIAWCQDGRPNEISRVTL